MKLILSVDALSTSLSGIGRYSWELASRLRQVSGIDQIRYYRAGEWIRDPAALLVAGPRGRKGRFKYPRWAKDWYWRRALRGQVFHAPNYFLPPHAENGVVTVHDLSVFRFPETHPLERVKQFEKSFRQTLELAAHLITDSETTRREVIDFFAWAPERISTVHLGVSSAFAPRSATELAPALARFGLKPGGYALCVSTIEPRKRIDALLDAYGRLPDHLRETCSLVLAGHEGWRSEHLHALIDRGQRAGWLQYLGFVADADLATLYAGARVFAYPSIYEGFGLPVVEAMASGVPVIASDRSCLPEVAAGAARLVNPDDIAAFAAGLEESLLDLEWREKAITCGLRVAARYDWAECVKRTAAVYAAVARN